jgi:hypothetical protein
MNDMHFCATDLPMGLQGRKQTGLAGALGAEYCDI